MTSSSSSSSSSSSASSISEDIVDETQLDLDTSHDDVEKNVTDDVTVPINILIDNDDVKSSKHPTDFTNDVVNPGVKVSFFEGGDVNDDVDVRHNVSIANKIEDGSNGDATRDDIRDDTPHENDDVTVGDFRDNDDDSKNDVNNVKKIDVNVNDDVNDDVNLKKDDMQGSDDFTKNDVRDNHVIINDESPSTRDDYDIHGHVEVTRDDNRVGVDVINKNNSENTHSNDVLQTVSPATHELEVKAKENDVSDDSTSDTQSNSSVETEDRDDEAIRSDEENKPSFMQRFVSAISSSSSTSSSGVPDKKDPDVEANKTAKTSEAVAVESHSFETTVPTQQPRRSSTTSSTSSSSSGSDAGRFDNLPDGGLVDELEKQDSPKPKSEEPITSAQSSLMSSTSSSMSSLSSDSVVEVQANLQEEKVDVEVEEKVATWKGVIGDLAQYVNATSSETSLSSFFDGENAKKVDNAKKHENKTEVNAQVKEHDENILSDAAKKHAEPVTIATSTSSLGNTTDAEARKEIAKERGGKSMNRETKRADRKRKVLSKKGKSAVSAAKANQKNSSDKTSQPSVPANGSGTPLTDGTSKPTVHPQKQSTRTSIEKTKNDKLQRARSDSESSSSDITSDSTSDITTSSSSTEDEEQPRNPPTTPASGVKRIQISMRPKSAKPPRTAPTRPNPLSTPSTPNEKPKRPRRRKISTSTSSVSSAVNAESNHKDRPLQESEIRDQRARELFLHRCLDEYLASQLDKQRAFFQRGYNSPRRRRRPKSKKSTMTSSSVARKRWEPRSRDHVRSSSDAILPAFSPRVREEDVKRNILRLVSELARHENMRTLMRPIHAETDSGKKHQRKNKGMHERRDSVSDQSSSSESSSSMSSQSFTTENRKVKNGVETEQGSEIVPQALNRSILKKEQSSNKKKKHVQLNDVRDDVFTYSRENGMSHRRERVPPVQSPPPRLAALLNAIGPTDYVMADNYGQLHRVTLKHTPIHPRTVPNRTKPTNQQKPKKRKVIKKTNKSDSSSLVSPHGDSQESKADTSVVVPKHVRPQTAKTTIDNDEDTAEMSVEHSPRIRPGTGPIKCNWNPENLQANKPEPKFSDHQLRTSANPAVLEWLSRKNNLARQTRIQKTRAHRTKRDELMQEQNDRDDKRAHALIEYEKWKKRKNRDILLRRRNETFESNGSRTEIEALTAEQQTRTILMPKDSSITTFSDLRSSASTPHPPPELPQGTLVTTGARRRPKSAPTKVSFGAPLSSHGPPPSRNYVPVRIDIENGDVTVLSPRNDVTNHSAREPIMQGGRNFMRDLLQEQPPPSMFDIPPPGTFTKKVSSQNRDEDQGKETSIKPGFEKEHYNNWVRSKGTSSPYQVKYKKKKKEKVAALPPHDPFTNELLSDLAKRRIKKIMDQKKRVDSGLRKKQLPDQDSNPAPNEESSLKKWRLKEEPGVNLNLTNVGKKQKRPGTAKERPKTAKRRPDHASDRPVFSYDRKTKSKSIFHERNPVINQALNG